MFIVTFQKQMIFIYKRKLNIHYKNKALTVVAKDGTNTTNYYITRKDKAT